jgi:hypothetical protein
VIRFRFTEDEKRYLALLSALYRNFATHLPPHLVSACMRDLGKLQDTLLLEGVRQGVAVAELSELGPEPNLRQLKAFQAHAIVYGSQDTPLRDAELGWLQKWGRPANTAENAWLDNSPMQFAPDTFDAWEAERRVAPASARRVCPSDGCQSPACMAANRCLALDDPRPISHPESFPFETFPEEEGDVQDRPDLLDRSRDVLLQLVKSGNEPSDWGQMILALQRELHVDAGFLDLQMSTPMGRTVLDQCGLFNLRADRLNLQDLLVQQEAADPTDGDSSL